jgi:hypothetical protein
MSGLFLLAFAGLLTQESAPQPSTRATYQPPVVRPFEPGRDFRGEQAQGDRAGELFRRPLEAPVRVEAYARSYEFTPGDAEIAYEQGVASAEIRADQAAGRLDGAWQLVDASGQRLLDLILIDPGSGSIEGGWRGPTGRGGGDLGRRDPDARGLGCHDAGADRQWLARPVDDRWSVATGQSRPPELSRIRDTAA